jgi:D-glycero-D-manno-heptose 1,7-bisphosphate phosphatase
VVISNQAGVATGAIPEEELHRINDFMFKAVRQGGGDIAAWYYCTHSKGEGCSCRKPETGLFFKAAGELGLDLSDAFLVGDAETDIEAGHKAGCKTVLVLTGRARAEDVDRWGVKPCHIAQNLPDAVDWILSNARI